MSAADAFTRATISALSASVRLTWPLADLMYRVLPSTLSIVPATRWACCAEAVETSQRRQPSKSALCSCLVSQGGNARAENTPAGADRDIIRAAYRVLAKRYHPDVT